MRILNCQLPYQLERGKYKQGPVESEVRSRRESLLSKTDLKSNIEDVAQTLLGDRDHQDQLIITINLRTCDAVH